MRLVDSSNTHGFHSMENVASFLEEGQPVRADVSTHISQASVQSVNSSAPTPEPLSHGSGPLGKLENPTTDDETRRIVLYELSQPQRRKWSPEQIWRTLISKGYCTKREIVESIVEEIRAGFSSGRRSQDQTGGNTDMSRHSSQQSLGSQNINEGPQGLVLSQVPGRSNTLSTGQASNVIQDAPAPDARQGTSLLPPFLSFKQSVAEHSLSEDLSITEVEHCASVQRKHLRKAIDGLLTQIAQWGSSSPEEPPIIEISEANIRTRNRRYVPNYAITEEQVIEETLLWVYKLRGTLLLRTTSTGILEVANHLKELRSRLCDIGMPKDCIEKVGLGQLSIAEIVLHACGPEDWVLEDLWQCAADCLEDMDDMDEMNDTDEDDVEDDAEDKNPRITVAKRALDAAQRLGSDSSTHTEFYHATCHHYAALILLADGEDHESVSESRLSMRVFEKALTPSSPPEHVREMMRAVTTLFHGLSETHEGSETRITFEQIRIHGWSTTRDPALAFLLTKISWSVFEGWRSNPHVLMLDEALGLATHAVETLRSMRRARPSSVQPALAQALMACAVGAGLHDCHSQAIEMLEEATAIQQRLSRLGIAGIRVTKDLASLLGDHLDNQLRSRQWKDAMRTARCIVTLGSISGRRHWYKPLHECLCHFQDHLHSTRDSDFANSLIDAFRPILTMQPPPPLHFAFTNALLRCADLQRGSGAFDAALTTSREAVVFARGGISRDALVFARGDHDGMDGITYIQALACHAQALVDCDAYDEASTHLQEAASACHEDQCHCPSDWANLFGLFGVVHAHSPGPIGSSCIDKVIAASPVSTTLRALPCWLSVHMVLDMGTIDALAWLHLIRSITYYSLSPEEALTSANESLRLISQYYEQTHWGLKPYARASVLGYRYILLSLIGDSWQEAQSVLDDSVGLYRFIIDTEPNTALLPLIVFLEIFLLFFRNIPSLSLFATELKAWKKAAYNGSTIFFSDFVSFLKDLPRYMNLKIHISNLKINPDDASIHGQYSHEVAGVFFPTPITLQSRTLQHLAEPPDRGRSSARSLGIPPSRLSQSEVSVDLPGKTVRFTNTDINSPVSPQTSTHTKFNLDNIPNLTGSITIVKGPLCAGGFCDIFSGKLTSERGTELVAMKMLRVFNTEAHVVKAKKKFRWEVSLWRTLRHNHVLPFYGTCELDEFRLFMVSPWAEGGNALEYLRRNPFANRGRLLWQTSSALEYLHSGRDAQQVVHGDLKADNVLISAAGDALLCDFGLSRYVEEIISKSGSSSAGRAGGHARFMAPELLMLPKDSPATKPTTETDVYAFASLMLQIYTEQLPFAELPEAPAIIKLAHGELPPRPFEPVVLERGCDDQIWALMLDCWQFQPAKRPKMVEVSKRITAARL